MTDWGFGTVRDLRRQIKKKRFLVLFQKKKYYTAGARVRGGLQTGQGRGRIDGEREDRVGKAG